MENWLPVVGFEGFYEVSDLGRVRSVERMARNRWGTLSLKPQRLLSVFPDADGYGRVNLYRLDGMRQCAVHKLVLEAFVGPCPDGMQCLHANGVRAHSVLSNLSWGTPAQNCADRKAHGTGPAGIRNPKAKLNPDAVQRIRSDDRAQREIAAEFGVAQATISNIKLRLTWAEVS